MRKGLIALRLDGPPGGDARTGAAGRPLRDAPHRGEAAVVLEPHLALEAQPTLDRLHARERHTAHHTGRAPRMRIGCAGSWSAAPPSPTPSTSAARASTSWPAPRPRRPTGAIGSTSALAATSGDLTE